MQDAAVAEYQIPLFDSTIGGIEIIHTASVRDEQQLEGIRMPVQDAGMLLIKAGRTVADRQKAGLLPLREAGLKIRMQIFLNHGFLRCRIVDEINRKKAVIIFWNEGKREEFHAKIRKIVKEFS